MPRSRQSSSANAQTTIPMKKDPTPAHLSAVALDKAYRKGDIEVPVLLGVDLCVNRSEFLAVVGQSGCGKSTLLHLLGLLAGEFGDKDVGDFVGDCEPVSFA